MAKELERDNEISRRETHHQCGCGISRGCAHNDTELRDYINFGRLPNPDCPAIERWNNTLKTPEAGSGDNNG